MVSIYPNHFNTNVNNKYNVNYVITSNKYEYICNTSNQYVLYKNTFHNYTEKNLFKNIMENNYNIKEKIFNPFIDQLNKILSIFYLIEIQDDFLENYKMNKNYKICFHLVFKEILTFHNINDINEIEDINNFIKEKILNNQYSEKVKTIQKEENNIKIMFNDIFQYLFQSIYKINIKPMLSISFIDKREGVEPYDEEIMKRII